MVTLAHVIQSALIAATRIPSLIFRNEDSNLGVASCYLFGDFCSDRFDWYLVHRHQIKFSILSNFLRNRHGVTYVTS